MKSIAIITARGGSKRIPKKNIKEFCGKPIVAYSIEAALESGAFDEVMVSTDSGEIAEISKKFGANIPFLRSNKNSDDYASTTDVLFEVIDEYKKRGKNFDIVGCIYPTAPFITGKKLNQAMKKLENSQADSLVPVISFSYPPQRAFIIEDGYIKYNQPEYEKFRSQDLETLYHDCGQFYLCRTDAFLKYNSLVTPRTIPFILPETEVQDIDNYSDWELAEIKFKRMKEVHW